MSMYKQFRTDTDREQSGISLNYGDFRILIARAGGANKNYSKIVQKLTAPYRRAMQNGALPDDRALEIVYQAFAKAIILNWEVLTDLKKDVWKQGIEGEDGAILPFNEENVVKTFKALPDLFMDIQEQAANAALWRDETLKEAAKN